ncbi:MAG: indole-3-glycerol phosphate synthase TrpC [Alphaproteobacteria bacterium]|nr:indole-3-glycerol phosphate synthase TrpC [Alphaproteobacteria bacterium]
MNDVLRRILADKRAHVARRRRELPLAEVEARARSAPPPRPFAEALAGAVATGRYGLIAEIKKASPSSGLIRADFDPANLARAYLEGGASCLSVLTDRPHFQGRDEYLSEARAAARLPVLRKDFIVDPYQVAESRALGADCLLLILAALDDELAAELAAAAADWGLDVLVEVHDEAELERALGLGARLVGLNNRNLKTLEVDLATSERLAALLPGGVLAVSESGLSQPADLARMAAAGLQCFLVGEALMRQTDVAAATAALLAASASDKGVRYA